MATLESRWKRGAFLVCALILSGCGSKAPYEGKSIRQLENMLKSAHPAVQAQGAFGLSRFGAEARTAVPALVEALKSPHALVRQNAALALGQIGPEAAEAVPALVELLRDPEWAVRRQAALSLGQMGAAAQE